MFSECQLCPRFEARRKSSNWKCSSKLCWWSARFRRMRLHHTNKVSNRTVKNNDSKDHLAFKVDTVGVLWCRVRHAASYKSNGSLNGSSLEAGSQVTSRRQANFVWCLRVNNLILPRMPSLTNRRVSGRDMCPLKVHSKITMWDVKQGVAISGSLGFVLHRSKKNGNKF